MLNNVALDVVIGLVFVYLLYSLLATILSEIIATQLGLRARNLKEAVDRMLNDEPTAKMPLLERIWDSLRLMKNPKNPVVDRFYNNPEIKYLGSSGVFKTPSSFKAVSFSKTLLYMLNGPGTVDKQKISTELTHGANQPFNQTTSLMGKETAEYVLSLWHDSHGDLVKFKLQLENWFDRTMEQTTEWYKRKIRVVLIILGFMLAWMFNADTFTIIHKLATDDAAREQMVKLAAAYMENNKPGGKEITDSAGTPTLASYNQKMDSLLAVKRKLDADIEKANSLLGLGGWLPDTIAFKKDAAGKITFPTTVEEDILPESLIDKIATVKNNKLAPDACEKWYYFFSLFLKHFWGFFVTAIAISLGAPFWFDLLNKLMKLRTSIKQPTDSSSLGTQTAGTVSPLNREG